MERNGLSEVSPRPQTAARKVKGTRYMFTYADSLFDPISLQGDFFWS